MTYSVFDVLDGDREWTFDEEDFMRYYFFSVSMKTCTGWLHRSVVDVHRKAVFMGLLLRCDGFDEGAAEPVPVKSIGCEKK